MSIRTEDEERWREAALAAEYVARADRLAPLFPRARPLPARLAAYPPHSSAYPPHSAAYPPHSAAYSPHPLEPPYPLAYTPPHNLALELSRSILYERADSVDAKLRSLTSPSPHASHSPHVSPTSRDHDSLWNGKPQQYFESMNYGERAASDNEAPKEYDSDSLAP